MKVGDLVTRCTWRDYCQIMEAFPTPAGLRLNLLCLMTGNYYRGWLASNVKVLSQ